MWLQIQRNKKPKESLIKKPYLKRISTTSKFCSIDENVENAKKNKNAKEI